jgi:hypothetical protein
MSEEDNNRRMRNMATIGGAMLLPWFIRRLLATWWVPFVVAIPVCLLLDINYFEFWKLVLGTFYDYTIGYIVYAWNNWDRVVDAARCVFSNEYISKYN